MSNPVLNLDAELQRSEVTYKGNAYELRNSSELSIVEAHHLSNLLHDFDEVDASKDEESASKSGALLQSVVALLVEDPPEGGFPDQLCATILSFWTEQNRDPEADPTPRRRAPQDRKPKAKAKAKASTGAR